MNGIKLWLNGYVVVCINGREKERFISLCKNKCIKIYNLQLVDNKYICEISIAEYKNIHKIVKKTHILPKIIRKSGLPFLYSKYKNRQSLIIGLFIGIMLFYIASGSIWNIKIEGENYFVETELIRFLKENNITIGNRISSIKCNKIEKMIRTRYKDIGWVSAQIEGTYLIITIKENVKYDMNNEKEDAASIVASVNGVVEKLKLRNGIAMVKVGDSVKKGDVIVSGIVDINNDAGEVVSRKAIRADADVWIKYDKEYYFQHNRKYNNRIYTNRKRREYRIMWDTKYIIGVKNWLPFIKQFDNYDVMINNYNVSLCKNLYTPIELITINRCEYKSVLSQYTDIQLEKIAKNEFNRYQNKLKKQNKIIIDKNIDLINHKLGIIAKGYVVIRQKENTVIGIDKSQLKVDTTGIEGEGTQ